MSTIKLALKHAREIDGTLAEVADWMSHHTDQSEDGARLLLGLVRRAITLMPSLAPRKLEPLAATSRKAKAEKRKRKSDETHELREQALSRANGKCEFCGVDFMPHNPGEWDHFFGKGRIRQSLQTTWLLHRSCHHAKTNNRPDAGFWLERFIAHCAKHGYHAEAERARARLEGIVAVRAREAGR